MCLKLSGASDPYPQLLQILWKIHYIWIAKQGTVGEYEKQESGIVGQRAESLFIKIRWN